jgi:hypothetical protein
MKCFYNEYNNLNVDEEILKISASDEADLMLFPNNKMCLFLLGVMFAYGKKINIMNMKDINLEVTNKSFSLMTYVWDRLGNNDFPNKDFSNVATDMDKRIENIKRLGVRNSKIIDNQVSNKVFLICPVRNATEEQKRYIEDFVKEKNQNGIEVHAPHMHTVQQDMFGGYTICYQNANAIANSSEIDMYYDQNSTGSVFDLGVAYALNKKLVILNIEDITFDENDQIDCIVKEWNNRKSNYQPIIK